MKRNASQEIMTSQESDRLALSRDSVCRFMNNGVWTLTFNGGLQRASVDNKNADTQCRKELRRHIKKKITDLVDEHYSKETSSEDDHIKYMDELRRGINQGFSNILKKEEIKLGVVQKLLNLYLKFQWILGCIPEPPHCPFDRIIISKLVKSPIPPWTKISSRTQYMELVKAARRAAEKEEKSIARWELGKFHAELSKQS